MGASKPRWARRDSKPGPLLQLQSLSEWGRKHLWACFVAQAKQQRKELIWDDAADWPRIDDIRLSFFKGCASEFYSIGPDEPDLIDKSAALLRGASAQLKAALDLEDYSPWFWKAIAAGGSELTRERLAAFAQTLDNRAEALNRLIPKQEIKPGYANSRMIARLAAMFRDKGLKPTAGMSEKAPQWAVALYREDGIDPDKYGAPPSPFVALVAQIMMSMPPELQTKRASLEAFSQTVRRELRRRLDIS